MTNPLRSLISRITGRALAPEAALPQPDARLALGALLVRVARADDQYLFEEISQIDRILARQNDIGPVEAAKLRATCEKLERATPDTAEFARLLREGVPYEDRRAFAEALWQVALADGVEHAREAALVDLVEDLLGVSQVHSQAAREAARVIP